VNATAKTAAALTSNPQADMLGRALDALEQVQNQLERERAAQNEAIAVVGLGCRFPDVDGADAFVAFLDNGGDAVREIPGQRNARFAGDELQHLRRGGFFEDVAGFDADFFGLSDEEAVAMDPHQRLLLEVAWQALEDAGAAGGSLAGTCTGVYLGLGAQNSDYAWWLLNDSKMLDRHAIAGSFHSLMPGRLSYLLDLRGPSMVVDAACASGLAAVHLACQALRRRECDAAIAAAVNLVLSPLVSLAVQRSGLWSENGHCRAFDATADGFVRGEGCGVLVLKRLSDAIAQGDAIRGVIYGSAVGQDGRSNGLTAPNGPAQEAVIRRALEQSGIAPAQVGYVEAHATGTLLGDAIEAEALGTVYGPGRVAPLLIGALKPNLGHLEAASGMAGLIKTLLSVERRSIAPTLHHAQLNPDIDTVRSRITVVTRRTDWPENSPYAGVSAFGMSGTNAHLVVGPAPMMKPTSPAAEPGPRSFAILWLGAHEEPTLRELSGRIAAALTPQMKWSDVCASLNAGRKSFPVQIEIGADSIDGARQLLKQAALGVWPLAAVTAKSTSGAGNTAGAVQKVRLPTYPFRHRHFWPALTSDPAASITPVDAIFKPVHIDGMLNQLNWQATPLAVRSVLPRGPLLLAGDETLAQAMAGGLAASGFVCAEMANVAASRLQGIDWKAALDAVPDHDVIYFCAPENDGLPHDAQRAQSLGGLLALVKAMADEAIPRRLFIVVVGAWQGAADPAMAISLGRSITLEHPDLRCRCIDFDASLADAGIKLAHELAATDGEDWVRHTAAGRLVPRIMPMVLPQKPFLPRATACYLISGGFGGIGRALASWLVERGARDLMLVGRSIRALPEAAEWLARGVRIRAIAADIADPAGISAALAGLAADGVPLAGVFHTAGIQDDALLYRHAWQDFAEVLRAKVDGAKVLHDATLGQPLDAFVLFSSVSALCGLTGAGAYAAANAALGALARRWRASGVPALSVMWGTWEGSGMATAGSAQLATHWDHLGILPFAASRGTAALEALLTADLAEAVAADIDWEKLARWARADGAGAKLYENCTPDPAALPVTAAGIVNTQASLGTNTTQVPDAVRSEMALSELDLNAVVRESVAKVLGLAVNDPALDQPFGELGLNSLAAIELRTQLSARLGIAVPATVAFNHPSVGAVTKFLRKRMAMATAQSPRLAIEIARAIASKSAS
jgi:acyl transferase domain-containing protein/acyl carrier protein